MAEISKTVDQALRVLESLREDGPAPVGELARRLETGRTVVSRLVATLEAHALVRPTGRGYDLGFGLLRLAGGLVPDMRRIAEPHLRSLAERFDETTVLAAADGDEAVAVHLVVPERQVVRVHYRPGFRHPLVTAAHGRAILAFAAPATIDRLTGGSLAAELATIRERGYALTHDELEHGVVGIAAPVVNGNGAAVASIGLVAPSARYPERETVAAAVIAAAGAVAGELHGLGSIIAPDAFSTRTA